MTSKCPQHGEVTSDHVWDDSDIYQGISQVKMLPGHSMQVSIDTTYKCNLNCTVCFARANEYDGANEFKKEDILLLSGARQLFLTGGEPTMREDIADIIRFCVKNHKKPILFSNGIKMANKKYLRELKKAGLRSVLLQFDSLDDADLSYIRGRDLVKTKIQALDNLKDLNIPVAIWSVIVKGRNLKKLAALHKFLLSYPNVKTVSAIPIWRIGRYNAEDFVPPSVIIRKLRKIYHLENSDFISTTQLVCNIDRLLSIFDKKRGILFGKCMLKALLFKYKGKYIPISKVFNVSEINQRVDKLFEKEGKFFPLAGFIGYFLKNEIAVNFFKNKYFRSLVLKMIANLRFLFYKRNLLLNPFVFITVGIFPNKDNIDLKFIRACNSYSLCMEDYSLRPACLHHIALEEKK